MQAHSYEIEKFFEESDKKYEQIKSKLRSEEAMKMSHSEVETTMQVEGMKLMRQMVQDHYNIRRLVEQERKVVDSKGIERKKVIESERKLMTIFGSVIIGRLGYKEEAMACLYPMDGELNLPKELYSLELRKRVAKEAAKNSFEEVVETIGQTTGARVAKRQAEELTVRTAADFDAFYQRRQANESNQKDLAPILVITTDAKGIVVQQQDLREATKKAAQAKKQKTDKRLSKGEKRHRKRMAQVASVYSIEPFIRTAQDVVKELDYVRDTKEEKQRPKPENKRVWASIEKQPQQVIAQAFEEANKRDEKREKQWVALVDGNPTQIDILEKSAAKQNVTLIIILDIIHVLEYLWKASFAFHKDGTKEAQQWVRERLILLLEGHSQHVAAGMRQSATKQKLQGKNRAAVDKCADYLLKYAPYLHYDQYLAAGFPIATGVIEGACRHLIKDRMDLTGARWRLKGAEAVLRLRSLRSSKDFDDYWRFHLQQEFKRNHAHLYINGQLPPHNSAIAHSTKHGLTRVK